MEVKQWTQNNSMRSREDFWELKTMFIRRIKWYDEICCYMCVVVISAMDPFQNNIDRRFFIFFFLWPFLSNSCALILIVLLRSCCLLFEERKNDNKKNDSLVIRTIINAQFDTLSNSIKCGRSNVASIASRME